VVSAETDRYDPALEVHTEGCRDRRGLPDETRVFQKGMKENWRLMPWPQPHTDYELPPFMSSHYTPAAAFMQKIMTLATRRETQARDVFDLHLLIASGAVLTSKTASAQVAEHSTRRGTRRCR